MDEADFNRTYQRYFQAYGASPGSLGWSSYRAIAIRYAQLVSDLNIEGKSILDAGCGMGDLLPFLYAKTDNFKYLGVDLNPDFIEVAKKRFEGHDFRVMDVFEQKINKRFDLVFSSGVLNHNVDNWLEHRKKRISRLYELANEALAFNTAASFKKRASNEQIAYADALEIIEFCARLTPKLIVKSHYNNRDLTIVMFK